MTRTKKMLSIMLAMALLLPCLLITSTAMAIDDPIIYRVDRGPDYATVYFSHATAASPTGPVSYTAYAQGLSSYSSSSSPITIWGLSQYSSYSIRVTATQGGQTATSSAWVTPAYSDGWPWYYDNYSVSSSSSTYSGSGTLTYVISAPEYRLNKVAVDRQTLSEGTHYTVSSIRSGSGKTQIVMKESFLRTLSTGYHEFTFSYWEGTARASLKVTSQSTSGNYSGNYYGNYYSGLAEGKALRSLTVYNKASTKGKKLGTYAKGATFEVIGFTSSGTYAIVSFGGEEGYVRSEYINAGLSQGLTGWASASTTLYTAKSTKSKYAYMKVSKGTVLLLLAREGSYWLVDYGNERLYVRAKYVKNLTVG